MYRFWISSSGDHTTPALGLPSRSDRRHRLHRSVAMAVRDDQCRSVGSMPVAFYSPLNTIISHVPFLKNNNILIFLLFGGGGGIKGTKLLKLLALTNLGPTSFPSSIYLSRISNSFDLEK